jgi:streptogramin lyase
MHAHRRDGGRQAPSLATYLMVLCLALASACSAYPAPPIASVTPRPPATIGRGVGQTAALPVEVVGQTDGGPSRLRLPTGLALDRTGRLFVVDAGNDRVRAITGTGGAASWGSYGQAPGQFRFREATDSVEPFAVSVVLGGGLAADPDGHLYVADPLNGRVQKFDTVGLLLAVWDGSDHAGGLFGQPAGLAVDGEGAVYVADRLRHSILKLNSDGRLLLQWGGEGSHDGALFGPMALAIDQRGQVHVADRGDARIQTFDTSGRFRRAWGGRGAGPGEFGGEIFLAVDEHGFIYVSDTANHRVQVFRNDGAYLTEWGRLGVDEGEFSYPGGIVVDGQGDIYVADTGNGRIQRFRPRGPWPDGPRATPTPRPAPTLPVSSAAPAMTPTDR